MLPLTAAAPFEEMFARRLGARWRRRDHVEQLAARERLGLLRQPHAHAIARRRPRHERHATIRVARDAIATGGERGDVELDLARLGHRYGPLATAGITIVPRGATNT